MGTDGVTGLIDAEVAALMLQVTPRRVRQMTGTKPGQLTNHGTRYKMLYRYADVAAIVETRKPKT